jgi:hypothetical protein
MKFTEQQVAFMNRLNNLLIEYEYAIVERQKHYHKILQQKIASSINDVMNTNDYEVFAEVAYYYDREDGEALHTYHTSIGRNQSEDDILCTNTDWRESDAMPALDKPYCYLMHDLVYHGNYEREELFKIETIWVDIHVMDQHCVKLKTNK